MGSQLGYVRTMPFRSGDVLTYNPDDHYVYELLDERGNVFYVGRSNCPQGRLKAHWDSGRPDIQGILKKATRASQRIIAGPMPEHEAIVREKAEIDRPGRRLLNQEHRPTPVGWKNERLPVFQQFCRTASKAENS